LSISHVLFILLGLGCW